MLIFIYLLLGLATSNEMDWFDHLVKEQIAYATKNYPQPEGTPHYDLLEACGGVGSQDGIMAPGECIPGTMNDTSTVPYVRLVLTPNGQTKPTVLAMVNVQNNTTEY